MCRIGGSLGAGGVSPRGGGLEIPPWRRRRPHPGPVKPGGGPRLVGSLTGAVASQSVTEAPKGSLRPDGNRPERARAARELDCEADRPSRGESRA